MPLAFQATHHVMVRSACDTQRYARVSKTTPLQNVRAHLPARAAATASSWHKSTDVGSPSVSLSCANTAAAESPGVESRSMTAANVVSGDSALQPEGVASGVLSVSPVAVSTHWDHPPSTMEVCMSSTNVRSVKRPCGSVTAAGGEAAAASSEVSSGARRTLQPDR